MRRKKNYFTESVFRSDNNLCRHAQYWLMSQEILDWHSTSTFCFFFSLQSNCIISLMCAVCACGQSSDEHWHFQALLPECLLRERWGSERCAHGSMPPPTHFSFSFGWMRKITAITCAHSRYGRQAMCAFWTRCIQVWKANKAAPQILNIDKKPFVRDGIVSINTSQNYESTLFMSVCLNTHLLYRLTYL